MRNEWKNNKNAPELLRIQGLKKRFGKTEVLKGVDFSVHPREIISVLGPSGCGKSTLLNIIAGLLAPDEGSVEVNGEVLSKPGYVLQPERRRMNMVFQDFALWPHLTAYENIVYGLRRRGWAGFLRTKKGGETRRHSETEIKAKAEELLELLHLQGYERRYPAELSGGQQQRVAIARALITEPEILLMDEPLCNLDVQLRVEMRTEMAFLFRRLGTTVFHVTHDPSEAFAMADRIIVMNQGRIDQIDTPQNCYRHPATESVAALLGAGNRLHGRKAGPDSVLLSGCLLRAQLEQEKGTDMPGAGTPVLLRFRAESAVWRFGAADSGTTFGNAFGDTCRDSRAGENVPCGAFSKEESPCAAGFPQAAPVEDCFPVQVEYASFEGDFYRVRAVTEEGETVTFLSRTALEKGARGFVQVAPKQLYAYVEAS